jgi:hypothetical protein
LRREVRELKLMLGQLIDIAVQWGNVGPHDEFANGILERYRLAIRGKRIRCER